MSQHFDENFESVLTLQASRPLGRGLAWVLGIVLAAALIAVGTMFLDNRTQKQRIKAAAPATPAGPQGAPTQPESGR
ncbi:MAG: hypothetical protein VYE77_00225 [Planctomycetota bacterium]|nr:hypothetical protein [Planctomycetota bacterium]